ncbi:hypothetical protein [Streptomyces sp. NPDC013455]|uniref:hypothetical protein n=1 Tax=Streptomyces sp. NPDC013455 TaxID=3155605 RepID=UPI0033CBFA01
MSVARRRTAKALAAILVASCAALATTAATAQDTTRPTTRTQALDATTGWQSPAPATVQDTTGWQ